MSKHIKTPRNAKKKAGKLASGSLPVVFLFGCYKSLIINRVLAEPQDWALLGKVEQVVDLQRFRVFGASMRLKAAETHFRACSTVSGLANGSLETVRKDMWRGFARQGCVQKCGQAAEKRFRACKEVSGLANGSLETLRIDMWRGFARQGCVQKCCQSCREAFAGLQDSFRLGKQQSWNGKKGHVTGLCKARLCPKMWPKLPRNVSGLAKRFPAWQTAVSKR